MEPLTVASGAAQADTDTVATRLSMVHVPLPARTEKRRCTVMVTFSVDEVWPLSRTEPPVVSSYHW